MLAAGACASVDAPGELVGVLRAHKAIAAARAAAPTAPSTMPAMAPPPSPPTTAQPGRVELKVKVQLGCSGLVELNEHVSTVQLLLSSQTVRFKGTQMGPVAAYSHV